MSTSAGTVVRRFWEEIWSLGRAELVEVLFHPDAVQNGEPLDRHAFADAVVRWRAVFPDFVATIEELVPLERDRVLSRVTYRGTQAREWGGIPASGRTFVVCGIDLFRVSEGRIVELWHAVDHLDMALQLGARLAPAQTAD